MVRMTDIMKDIQEECYAMEVAFASHSVIITADQGVTVEREARSATSDCGKLPESSLIDSIVNDLRDHPEQEEPPFSEHLWEAQASSGECQRCGSTKPNGPCMKSPSHTFLGNKMDQTLTPLYVPSVTSHTSTIKPLGWPSYTKTGEPFVWYCSRCNDGPYGSWQLSCQACGHAKCFSCTMEETK
jgi:hypothetical protein